MSTNNVDRTNPFQSIKCPECNGKLTFRPPGIVCKENKHHIFDAESDIWHRVKDLVTTGSSEYRSSMEPMPFTRPADCDPAYSKEGWPVYTTVPVLPVKK